MFNSKDKTHHTNLVARQCRRLLLIILLYAPAALAWDITGHRLSGEVAYQNLSKCAKQHFDQHHSVLRDEYPFVRHPGDFAAFPDFIKLRGVNTYNHWHYIAQPWYPNKANFYRELNPQNARWALQQAQKNSQNKQIGYSQRAFYLSFVWHILADIHQPLHTISRYSKRHPNGDLGGLRFKIRHPIANNLHQLWDNGIDHFGAPQLDYPFRHQQVKRVASSLQKKYPKENFKTQLADTNIEHWIADSSQIAKQVSYHTQPRKRPKKAYLDKASEICQQQIVLSGYRIAQLYENMVADVCRHRA